MTSNLSKKKDAHTAEGDRRLSPWEFFDRRKKSRFVNGKVNERRKSNLRYFDEPVSTDEERAKRFGWYIRKLRFDRDWSLRDLEEKTGNEISNPYLSQIERGERNVPRLEIIKKLSIAFNEPIQNFIQAAGFISGKWVMEAEEPGIAAERNLLLSKYEELSPMNRKILMDFADVLRKNSDPTCKG